ncbi:MAG TPA: S16 family serine protease, partial [Candidatus Obscuribacterales bacterium]
YTREAGVRNLERSIATICRKVAMQIVKGDESAVKMTPQNTAKYLGPPKVVREEETSRIPQVGIVNGLAWTETGGELLQIEVNTMPGKGKVQLTGQLGDVMKESAAAALSYIRSHNAELGIKDTVWMDTLDIHIHLPEGAIPKDGPSAGVALTVALYSAIAKRPVRASLAMTGEVTLRGRVLTIGGLKEKVLAALRAQIKTVLFPIGNVKDLQDIPDYVKERLELIPVSHLDEVFNVAFKKEAKQPVKAKAAAAATNGKGRSRNGSKSSSRRSALGRVK